MKKIILPVLLLVATLTTAQETNSEKNPDKLKAFFTYGVNLQVHDEFAINSKLNQAGLPELKTTTPELFLGMTFFGKKYSGDLDFGFLNSKNENDANENKYIGFTTRLRVHYNVINKEKIAFTTGLNISNTTGELNIYSKNNPIDLNNLVPDFNSGHVSLRNNLYYAGPSASVYFFKNKTTQLRLNVGYEFAFSKGNWKSDYGNVLNSVNERGNNRFLFGLTIM